MDIEDVMNAVAQLAADALYPNGVSSSSAPSIAGPIVKIAPGWPAENQLDCDLRAGIVNVSVFPLPQERNTTRYRQEWEQISVKTPTLAATVNGQTVTFAGDIPSQDNPTNIMMLVDGRHYAYAVKSSDTLSSLCSALAAQIAGDIPGTTSLGAVIRVPVTSRITAARVGITGVLGREVGRQERMLQITVWANTPDNRKAVASVIDVALRAAKFAMISEGTGAKLTYKSSPMTDNFQKAKLYRRDFLYQVEYGTIELTTATQVTQETVGVGPMDVGLSDINTLII